MIGAYVDSRSAQTTVFPMSSRCRVLWLWQHLLR